MPQAYPSLAGRDRFFLDLDKGALKLLIAAKGLNFAFGLTLVGRRGEAFGDRFAIHLIGQPGMMTVVQA